MEGFTVLAHVAPRDSVVVPLQSTVPEVLAAEHNVNTSHNNAVATCWCIHVPHLMLDVTAAVFKDGHHKTHYIVKLKY